MNSSPGDRLPYNPPNLLGELDTTELLKLQNGLSGPWQENTRSVRIALELEIEDVRTYMPDHIISPSFETRLDKVDRYLSQARQVNHTAGLNELEISHLKTEAKILAALSAQYTEDPVNIKQLPAIMQQVPAQALSTFFTKNLQGIILPSRAVSFRLYGAKRDALLQQHLSNTQGKRQEAAPVTAAQARAARNALADLPSPRAPYPDFFQLSTSDQETIINTTGKRWQELCSIINHHNPKLLIESSSWTSRPLGYLSANDLSQAIDRNKLVDPIIICRTFLNEPENFSLRMDQLKRGVIGEAAAQAFKRSPQAPIIVQESVDEAPAESTNAEEIQTLLDDTAVNGLITEMGFGEIVALTPADAFITCKDLDRLVDKHLLLMARFLYEQSDPNSQSFILRQKGKGSIGDRLRAGSNARIQNLTITRLPATDELLGETYKDYAKRGLALDRTIQLLLAINLKSSGHKARPSTLPVVIAVSKNGGKTDQVFITPSSKATGAVMFDGLRQDSARMARAVQGEALVHAVAAGLPTHGKSKR